MNNYRILALAIIVTVLGSTAAIVGLSIRVGNLETRVASLEAVQLEMLALQELQATTHEGLLGAVENHSASINALNESTTGLLYIIEVHREDHVESIAEIYQGHIIELRAFHMNPENFPEAFPSD